MALALTGCAELSGAFARLQAAVAPTPTGAPAPAAPTAVPQPTATPVVLAATALPNHQVRFVLVRDPEGQLVWMDLPVKPRQNPGIGLQPNAGAGRDFAFVLAGEPLSPARFDVSGLTPVFTVIDAHGLALQPTIGADATGRLAWGGRPDAGTEYALFLAESGGGSPAPVLTAPQPIAAAGWSPDGRWLYYALEPEVASPDRRFPAASSLYRFDPATGISEALVPFDAGRIACIDDLAPDGGSVVERCGTVKELIIRYLGGPTTTIQAPPTIKGDAAIGSARFSPDGRKIAFALTSTGLPETISWIAVSDGLGGGATQVLQSGPNEHYDVIAWLGPTDLLVQGRRLVCDHACESLYVLNLDAGNRVEFALGVFVAFAAPTVD